MAVSFAIASRSELLSMMSGKDISGERDALTMTYITCPVFTCEPAAGDCSKMQSGGNDFT